VLLRIQEATVKFDPKKTLFLIDGSSFLYRAYYSLRPLHTNTGIPVQAVYSFCRMIKKLLATFDPSFIAVVWDSKGKTVRHEMYQEYKATRQEAPTDLFDQKEYIMQFADMIGLKQIHQSGIEADDIMYSLARELTQQHTISVVLVTSDKDMAQALDERIMIFDPFKESTVTRASFEEKMGFPVVKLPFYYALIGDSSDNIPGVRGIGPKGAQELVTTFASLSDLYENIEKVSKLRTQQLLLASKENAFLSEKLFQLHSYPFGLPLEAFSFDPAKWNNARPLFVELGFTSLLKEISTAPTTGTSDIPADGLKSATDYNFKTITTLQELHELCVLLQEKKRFALDTETDGLRPLEINLVGISFCVQEGEAYYIPCGHNTQESQLPRDTVLLALKPILEDLQYEKYLHNAKFDQLVLYAHGVSLRGIAFDSLIAAKLVIKDWQRPGLKNLSVYYFNEQMLTFEDMVKKQKLKDFSYVPISQATAYAAADAHQTFRLKAILEKELVQEKLHELYADIEAPLIHVLCAMEIEGIYLDAQQLAALNHTVTYNLQMIEKEILLFAGEKHQHINLNSPKQIEQLLFEELQLPPQKKNVKGSGYSTDQEVLEILADMHTVPALILKYRELFKLKSTYIDALPAYMNPKTGRIHTNYNQVAVATGRLASSEPNLQNIPTASSSSMAGAIRAAFKPKPGHVFLSADYSQIELRVLAQVSQDPNLVAAFLAGHDIHAQTAASLFEVPLDQVTTEQRQVGKRINFSILYGLTPYGLSKDLKISFKDAKTYIEKYFAQYPAVSAWMEQVISATKEKGYVQTVWGRRRYIPGIYERNKSLYEEARRVAINTKAQGTAAEVMKIGMINLHNAFIEQSLDAQILLQIHDELLITVHESLIETVDALTKKTLESVVDWNVPLVVSTRWGRNWHEVSK
jgi:DNA polymerase I